MFVERVDALSHASIGEVHREKGVGEPGHVGHDGLQILAVGDKPGENGVGERLAHVADEFLRILVREHPDVHREALRESHHDLRGQRSLIVLDLVQIARRNAQPFGERALIEAMAVTQPADLRTSKNLLTHAGL